MLSKFAVIAIMRKAARCWAGYEPVPGAKAYSEGSCRPKGSKKTKKEVIQGKRHTEKKAAPPFDVAHARAVFQAHPVAGLNPETATPAQLHTRMRNILNPTSSNTNSMAAKLLREHYNNVMPNMPQPELGVAAKRPTAATAVAPTPALVAPASPPGAPAIPAQPSNSAPVPGPPRNRPTLSQASAKLPRPTMTQMNKEPTGESPAQEWGGQ